MYSAETLDHFQNPRNPGDIAQPDASIQLENPVCGDILKLSVKVVHGRIVEAGFRAKGCVPAMACGSAVSELISGKTVAEARSVTREEILIAVGGLPEASGHAAYLAMDALKGLLQKLP